MFEPQIVHSRTAYEDTSGQQRHLLRLWLSLPIALPFQALPPDDSPHAAMTTRELLSAVRNGAAFAMDTVVAIIRKKLGAQS
jgi:hypothetical protein